MFKIKQWDKIFNIKRLKLGRPCTSKVIKIGEVFGSKGCFAIFYRVSKFRVMLLDTDEKRAFYHIGKIGKLNTKFGDFIIFKGNSEHLDCFWSEPYKLPKETQELYLKWKD